MLNSTLTIKLFHRTKLRWGSSTQAYHDLRIKLFPGINIFLVNIEGGINDKPTLKRGKLLRGKHLEKSPTSIFHKTSVKSVIYTYVDSCCQHKYMIGFMLSAINICGWSYKCSNSKEKIPIWLKMDEVASAFFRHVLG